MNKRKILTLAMALCMVAILAIGGTLAYFTDKDYDKNVMTVGKLDIVQEETWDEETPLVPGGDRVRKEVDVVNEGTVDAYVRTLIAFEDTKDVSTGVHIISGQEQYLDWPGVMIKGDNGTVYTVGVITYPNIVPANGGRVDYMLSTVQLKDEVDNAWREIVGDKYDVIVLTQAANVGDNAEGNSTAQNAAETLNTAFGEVNSANAAEWFTAADTEDGVVYNAFTYPADYNGAEMWQPAFTTNPGDMNPLP